MSFDQEWADLKKNAQMRLNSAPSAGSGGPSSAGADLVVKYDDMGKIGHSAFLLHQHLSRTGKHAHADTETAAKSLSNDGFETGTALDEASKAWQDQLQVLLDACGQISNHLDYSVKSSKKDDHHIATQVKTSKISEYLDVPAPESSTPHIPKPEGPIM
ncbi:hypothetical protein AB0M68_35870 [Streptomyces sp. NPDC051453]|uniref:hypothetical protein n=1 Tax=Streptomyces sp. NPDC051453 TaxID=3154941 RepID=UPI003444820F